MNALVKSDMGCVKDEILIARIYSLINPITAKVRKCVSHFTGGLLLMMTGQNEMSDDYHSWDISYSRGCYIL